MKKPVLKRETILGKLTVWFDTGAFEHVERVLGGAGKIYANEQLDKFLNGGRLDPDVEVLNQIDKVPDRGHRFSVSLVMDTCPKCKGTQIGSEYKPKTELYYAHCFTCGYSWDGYEPSEELKEWLDPDHKKKPELKPAEGGELHFGHPLGSKTVHKLRKGVFEPKGTMPVEGDYVTYVEENNKEHRSRQVGQITDGIAYTEDRFMYDLLGFKEGRFRVLKRKIVEEEAQGFSFRSNDGEFFFRIRTRGNYFLWSAGGAEWEESDKRMHEATISTLDYIRVGPVIVEEWISKIKKQGLLG